MVYADADQEERAANKKREALRAAEKPDDDEISDDDDEGGGGGSPVRLIEEALAWFATNVRRGRPKMSKEKLEEARDAAVAGPSGWSKEKKKAQLGLFARLHDSYVKKRLRPKLITPYLARLSNLGRFNKVGPSP